MHIHAYKRTEATPIELFGLTIFFTPNARGDVVAEVAHEPAVQRLLSIPEAYREYMAASEAVASPAPVAPALAPSPAAATVTPASETVVLQEVAKGHSSASFPAQFEIAEGKSVTIDEVIASAQARAKLDTEEWNLNDEEDRDSLIELEVRHLIEAEQTAAAAPGEGGEEPPVAISLVLTADDGTTIDLGAMTATQVREFASKNGVILPGGNSTKVADLRAMVAQALTKA
ncbi:hypothetical protein [Variovorax sp.]|uniref:hypothetical protein n=1 Tax=Variovorax sp. TaxID=1871043 RepID=UPI003BAAD5FD